MFWDRLCSAGLKSDDKLRPRMTRLSRTSLVPCLTASDLPGIISSPVFTWDLFNLQQVACDGGDVNVTVPMFTLLLVCAANA